MTAEEFTSEFYKLWAEDRVINGLESFHTKAVALIASYAQTHDGVHAALQVLVAAAPLSDRSDVAKAMDRVYRLGAAHAESLLRPIARDVYLQASLVDPTAAAAYATCTDAKTLGAFICQYGDPIAALELPNPDGKESDVASR